MEPLSLDEAFVDLAAAGLDDLEIPTVTAVAERLREQVAEVTGGLTASVGVGSSKFIAKVASDLDKPDGLVVVPPGTEVDLLRPMHVSVIPGVGPATTERLRRVGIHTVADLESVGEDELVRMLGNAQGHGLHELAHARDGRPVVPERETKSVSVEGTYDTDLTDRKLMAALLTRQSRHVAERLRANGLAGRTVTIKVRLHDFTTLNRSSHPRLPHRHRRRPSAGSPSACSRTSTPPAAYGCSASASPGWPTGSRRTSSATTEDDEEPEGDLDADAPSTAGAKQTTHTWAPGMDVEHAEPGRGWVWGSGRGVVTVRFETAETRAGSGAQLHDRRPRPPTLETSVPGRGYSRGHARTTSLRTPLRAGLVHGRFTGRVVAYAALRELIPVFPVYALLFTDAGLSTGQVSTLLVIWSATHVVLEVPSGAWADTVSRRRLLVLASALYAGCFALWSAVPTYAAFAGGFVLWGLSGSLVSGTYEAYVYDHLYARQRQDSYRKVIAAGETSALVLNLVATAAATPIVALWGLTGAGWASVAVCVAATVLALWLPADAPRSHVDPEAQTSDQPEDPDLSYLGMLRAGLAESLHPSVARAVLLAAGVPAFLAFDEYFGLLADDLGVSLTVIPLLVALTVAAQAVGAALAPRLPMHRLGPVVVVAGLLVAGGAVVQRPAGFLAVAARVRRAPGRHRRRRDRPPAPHPRRGPGHRHLGERAAERRRRDRALRLRRGRLGRGVDAGADHRPGPARRRDGPGRRPRLPGHVAEADRLPGTQLSALPQVVGVHDRRPPGTRPSSGGRPGTPAAARPAAPGRRRAPAPRWAARRRRRDPTRRRTAAAPPGWSRRRPSRWRRPGVVRRRRPSPRADPAPRAGSRRRVATGVRRPGAAAARGRPAARRRRRPGPVRARTACRSTASRAPAPRRRRRTPPRSCALPTAPAPTRSTAPAGTETGSPQATACPSTDTSDSAPVTATVTASSARSVTPPSVVSSRAAPGLLPTRRLASRAAGASRKPDRGTPRCAWPGRPASCTVVSGPASRTVQVRGIRPPRTGPACPASAAPAPRG